MSKSKAKKLPSWATGYFEAALDRHAQLVDVIDISASGIRSLKGLPRIVEVLNDAQSGDQETYAARMKSAERRARLAESEEASDFSTLHGFGVVALWSWLESFVIDLVVLWVWVTSVNEV